MNCTGRGKTNYVVLEVEEIYIVVGNYMVKVKPIIYIKKSYSQK